MKFIKTVVILSSLALLIFACAENRPLNTNSATNAITISNANIQPTVADTTDNTADNSNFAESRKIYLETCVGCHRENGGGGAAEYEGKKIKVPSYQSRGAMNASDDKLYDYIANGEKDEMPAFKDKLTERQMRDLVKFIRQEFQKK